MSTPHTIKLRRSPTHHHWYHIRSGLQAHGLPAGWRVESDVFLSTAFEGAPQWVDHHHVFNQDGVQVCWGESLSDDMTFHYLSDLRAALAFYSFRWNGYALVVS